MFSLPRDTPVAIYFPSIEALIEDAEQLLTLLRNFAPESFPRSVRDALVQRIFEGGAASGGFAPERLRNAGIAMSSSMVVVPGVHDSPLILSFELTSRPLFERWIDELGKDAGHRITVGTEFASVLFPEADHALACIARQASALCQLGVSRGADPIAALRRIASGAYPLFGRLPGVVRAYSRLPSGARAYAAMNVERSATVLRSLIQTQTSRVNRFEPAEVRRSAERRAVEIGSKVEFYGGFADGVAVGVYVSDAELRVQFELAMSERSGEIMRRMRPASDVGGAIGRWAETPALVQVMVRTNPFELHRALSFLGLSLPAESLTGAAALLVLGIDPEMPAAVPAAAAIGVRTPTPPDLRKVVAHALSPGSFLHGRAFGTPIDTRMLDDILFLSIGSGSASAATRRLSASDVAPRRAERFLKPDSKPDPLFLAVLHLRAIDAALAAGVIDADSRPELVLFDALRKRGRSLLERVDAVMVTARAYEPERIIRVDLVARQ